MRHTRVHEPPRIDSSLDPIRAAIQMVADGSARRVTVCSAASDRLVPAARILARAAGVVLEAVNDSDGAAPTRGAAPRRIA